MSDQNVELGRRSVEAFNVKGVEGVLSALTPDVVVHPFLEWVEEDEYRGHEGRRRVTAAPEAAGLTE